jgi:hypothetical protein
MAQTVILAAGQTAARSSSVTIPAGGQATFAIRSATAGKSIPNSAVLPIQLSLGGGTYRTEASLMSTHKTESRAAAGAWTVNRDDISAYGVDIEVTCDQ